MRVEASEHSVAEVDVTVVAMGNTTNIKAKIIVQTIMYCSRWQYYSNVYYVLVTVKHELLKYKLCYLKTVIHQSHYNIPAMECTTTATKEHIFIIFVNGF